MQVDANRVGLSTYWVPQLILCKYRKMHSMKQGPISCSAKCLLHISGLKYKKKLGRSQAEDCIIIPLMRYARLYSQPSRAEKCYFKTETAKDNFKQPLLGMSVEEKLQSCQCEFSFLVVLYPLGFSENK